jgi:hypothetical protein
MNGAGLPPEADRFGWQVGQAPRGGTVKQCLEQERAAGQGPLDAMPPPRVNALYQAGRRGRGFPAAGRGGRCPG